MKPLICFSDNEDFLFSKNYERLDCPDNQDLTDFLQEIEKKYFSEMKVVQLNFDCANPESPRTSLYPAKKATVFVLKSFDKKSLNDMIHSENEEHGDIVFTSLIEKNEFIKKTEYVIEQIKKGRIYQANLTAPLKAHTQAESLSLFKKYQRSFSGAYKALLPLKEINVLSFSPELFLQQINGTLITRPIKGSLSQQQDFKTDLLESEKENAELSMIVDLLRNDLNSLSENFSSEVVCHRAPMPLGYIQHTYSEIRVRSQLPLSAIIEKTFPGGSISGCPKIESLRVIREVEDHHRQVYTGSIGWWKENNFGLNIAIRTMIQHQSDLYYHAGCGIVFDSDPEAEWLEYLLKTGSLNVRP